MPRIFGKTGSGEPSRVARSADGLGLDTPKNHPEGASCTSLLGTGETPDPNWQEEAHGLAGSVPANAHVARIDSGFTRNRLPAQGAVQ